ncbi:MAG: RNA 2',3'-cyclic phosphodiesterase [Thermoplasmata archaeon]
MRAFIALPVPELSIAGSERHLTLRFFPALDAPGLEAASRAVDRTALRVPEFDFTLEGFGGFPSLAEPRVVFRGVGPGRDRIVALRATLDAVLEEEGFAPEGRPFVPHVTVARIRPGRPAPHSRWPVPEPISVPAREIILFESSLTPAGAIHRPRHRAALSPIHGPAPQ